MKRTNRKQMHALSPTFWTLQTAYGAFSRQHATKKPASYEPTALIPYNIPLKLGTTTAKERHKPHQAHSDQNHNHQSADSATNTKSRSSQSKQRAANPIQIYRKYSALLLDRRNTDRNRNTEKRNRA